MIVTRSQMVTAVYQKSRAKKTTDRARARAREREREREREGEGERHIPRRLAPRTKRNIASVARSCGNLRRQAKTQRHAKTSEDQRRRATARTMKETQNYRPTTATPQNGGGGQQEPGHRTGQRAGTFGDPVRNRRRKLHSHFQPRGRPPRGCSVVHHTCCQERFEKIYVACRSYLDIESCRLCGHLFTFTTCVLHLIQPPRALAVDCISHWDRALWFAVGQHCLVRDVLVCLMVVKIVQSFFFRHLKSRFVRDMQTASQ